MNVCHVIPSLDPADGGPVEGVRQMAKALTRIGCAVQVVTLDSPDAAWLQDWPTQVMALGPTAHYYKYTSRLAPWLFEHGKNYDAVIINGLWRYSSFGAWRGLRRLDVPYFVYPHGMLDPWFRRAYPYKDFKKRLHWRLFEHRVLRDATAVLFTCEEERRLARRSFLPYICREEVVGYGTEAPPAPDARQDAAFLEQFPELREKRIILFVGRLHPKKGCDLLIQAFAEIARQDPGLHLVMAGPDVSGWKPQLIAMCTALSLTSRVTWTGPLLGGLKWAAYRSAELFALPSHQENFGLVVAEALGCGLPVVISNKTNIWREIKADEAGIVCDDTQASLCAAVRQWCEMRPEDQTGLRRRASECFFRRFEISSTASGLLSCLHKYGVS